MRFAKKEFEVQFDPGKISTTTLVETAAMRGRYRASRDGPVRSRIKPTALSAQGVAEGASFSKKSKGRLQIVLTPEDGKVVTGVELALSASSSIELGASTLKVEGSLPKKGKALVAKFNVSKKAEAGRHDVRVKLTYRVRTGPKSEESHTAELRLVVFVE